ncbi:MAG: hypothetical protein E8D45_06440 [Nitrospira sp.]|nr:MAG: hypothetical protein E8D45_06440 [Nitrospira sp.]
MTRMTSTRLITVFLLALVLVTGCATQPDLKAAQTASTYWPLDYAAASYSDPVAISPVNDNIIRWFAFALHPLGVAIDYALNRPLYTLASFAPGIFGYTSEDAGLHANRASVLAPVK